MCIKIKIGDYNKIKSRLNKKIRTCSVHRILFLIFKGSASNSHKTDSLFDAEAVENKGERRQYNTSWDYHMTTNTESVLLERTPAVSFDYVYQMEIPSDMSSEILSDLGSDHEYRYNFIHYL